MSEANNPFAGLIGASNSATNIVDNDNPNDTGLVKTRHYNLAAEEELKIINNIVENVFHFTINPEALANVSDCNKQLVNLEELSEAMRPNIYIDIEILEQALFERLLIKDPETLAIPKEHTSHLEHVIQNQVFPYLFNAFQNLLCYKTHTNGIIINSVIKMKELIYRNAVTALKQPSLFEGQNFTDQLYDLLKSLEPQSQVFFLNVIKSFISEGGNFQEELRECMLPIIYSLHAEVNKSNLINLPIYVFPIIHMFASNEHLAHILIESCEPKIESRGRLYQDSVLGALLSLSALPKSASASASAHEFFDNPMDQAGTSLMETSLWNASLDLTNNIHKLFLSLLKGRSDLRDRIMTWIGKCLKSNTARGKLWNVQAGAISAASLTCVSDGFMLNLGAVLLQLCQPFCALGPDAKYMKIDPTYAAVPAAECAAKSVHLDCLQNETCLLPPKEGADGQPLPLLTANSYSFVTECFFMTQKCIDLGVRVCAEKLSRIGQDLGRAQRALGDVTASNTAQHLVDVLRQRAQLLMTRFVTLRCSLMESHMLINLNRFQAMTCCWLVQVAVHPDPDTPQPHYAPMKTLPVIMPITTPAPNTLRCVPEFVLENIVVLITMSRRTSSFLSEDSQISYILDPALTLVLTFMGDSGRTYNPHLRARLAECMEAMLPNQSEDQHPLSNLGSYFRDKLFKDHEHRLQFVPCLLDVFVSIEMAGQFEQKFNYRRPMYLIMDFLWGIEEHRDTFTVLAKEAEANMEAVHPPIFLRFVNLLMNDAIFLLDDALENMAQIRTMQTAQESGAWALLPAQEREQNLANLNQIGMWARFDNILGKDTIRTLMRLTSHAPYVFCHPTLVDRIASMLNYFLLHLVGPKKKNLKVKDMKEFEFDPASIVLDISRMYVELGSNERFCAAVSDDGRSYSPQLFKLAQTVLVRIGGGALIGSLEEVATRVEIISEERQRDEEILANAPDEFLDPIMSTLMKDPVILPSSRTTVDRTTIARHLLSDQSDPFNRSPLSMDKVKSNTELKQRIEAWIAQQRDAVAANQNATS